VPDLREDLPEVAWTHDGFDAIVAQQDPDRPHRLGCMAGALGGLFGLAFVLGLAAATHSPASDPGLLLMAPVGLAFGTLVFGNLGMRFSRSLLAVQKRRVSVSATRLTWTNRMGSTDTRENWTALEDITGLRVQGPRPWRLLLELGEREVRIEVGTEAHARWLAQAIGDHIQDFHTRAGKESEVPRALRALTE
jgi:hypothetical protein